MVSVLIFSRVNEVRNKPSAVGRREVKNWRPRGYPLKGSELPHDVSLN